jgi:hypothetical protein
MNLLRASGLVCAVLLGGCSPEVVDLVVFGRDAAFELPDAGGKGESEFDASVENRDASTSERDARARTDADSELDAARGGCTSKNDCAPQETCSFTGCGSKRGTCVPLPSTCYGEPSKTEICGCDGFKYFNDCLRLHSGATLDSTCGALHTCDANLACPALNGEPTYCSRVAAGRTMCGRPSQQERACYVMPSVCPPYQETDYYSSCDAFPTGNGSSAEFCFSLCDAIKSSAPLWRTSLTRCAFLPRLGGGGGGFPGGGFTSQP